MNRFFSFRVRRSSVFIVPVACLIAALITSSAAADQSLESEQSWKVLSGEQMSEVLRGSLGEIGAETSAIVETSARFERQMAEDQRDPIDAFVDAIATLTDSVKRLSDLAEKDPLAAAARIDPSAADYAEIESLPKPIRMTVRTWLGRRLVRSRLYDEALPVIAEVEVAESIDPASALFYRGACYHALMMKKEALADLRTLLENEEDCPVRFSRLAKLMIADIKPLKEDSLDEISRLMTDVTRRLDLGRSGEKVSGQEQKIIDKLTKLIDKLEEQQQQQQQQQQGGGQSNGNPQDGQASPMQDSQIAGGAGEGNVKKKNLGDDAGWGNLPPAERKEALQKISRDLPTHYRDAIEAYFRKRATDG